MEYIQMLRSLESLGFIQGFDDIGNFQYYKDRLRISNIVEEDDVYRIDVRDWKGEYFTHFEGLIRTKAELIDILNRIYIPEIVN